jgi:hypothetical protein
MKILLALETCDHGPYIARRQLIERTWAKRLPPEYDFQVFTGRRLGVPDDYNGLVAKTRAIAWYANVHHYDGLIICDDDAYVRTERLEIPEGDYAGCLLDEREDVFCSGAFYWLSRRALRILSTAPFNPLIGSSAEDRWAGWVMRENGIRATSAKVALKPCPCGLCEPVTPIEDWMAYIIDVRYTPEEFLSLEALYGPAATEAHRLRA